ncbi:MULTISPECIES: hypothetical protein [unclassified Duganella]|uniref:hypothetical protein n=1 Tax=unclassified Duganella TaxID=2636909 RepID=UPI0011C1B65E|nr:MULTISPECIES: hypothetical protein [unclassified Duganella]
MHTPFRYYFSYLQLLLVARIARAGELALWPVGGFYVLVVTLLTSMKLIIALLVPEVKRYVVISLILFRNLLIYKIIFEKFCVFFVGFRVFFRAALCHSITPVSAVLIVPQTDKFCRNLAAAVALSQHALRCDDPAHCHRKK